MIVMTGKEYFEWIIYKHLKKETTSQEEAELAAWLNEHPENLATYEGMVKIWAESSKLSTIEEFDKNTAWQSLEQKINAIKGLGKNKKQIYVSWSIRVAAVVILLALLAELVAYFVKPQSPELSEVMARQGNQNVQLPDGSLILLRAGSSLHFDRDFPLHGRRVVLAGEAYFQIQHDEEKPFRIQTTNAIIQVLGTDFLVRTTAQADQVFVTKGRVRVTEVQDSTQQVILTTGQTASIIGKTFARDSITDDNYLAWVSGKLEFDHAPLKKMIIDLNKYFQTDISLAEHLAAKSDTIKVNFKFDHNTLDQVLDEIHVTTGWTVERSGKKIILRE